MANFTYIHDSSTAANINIIDKESELLALKLMEEESIEAYNMQLQFLRENVDQLDSEACEAMKFAFLDVNMPQHETSTMESTIGDSDDEEEDSSWSYDDLLALGEMVGDVSQERWKFKANAVIDSLKTFHYLGSPKGVEDDLDLSKRACVDSKCVICLEKYCPNEMIVVLPCDHLFHQNCAQYWIQDHNSCPMCKAKIDEAS